MQTYVKSVLITPLGSPHSTEWAEAETVAVKKIASQTNQIFSSFFKKYFFAVDEGFAFRLTFEADKFKGFWLMSGGKEDIYPIELKGVLGRPFKDRETGFEIEYEFEFKDGHTFFTREEVGEMFAEYLKQVDPSEVTIP
jgi:hypothetical protein